jgi:hypothetical protein
MIFILFAACAPEERKTSSIFDINIEEYHMMTDFNSWTYRDDAPETPETMPDEAMLMLSQNDQGNVSFRRGSRWIEAIEAGSLQWSLDEGLTLLSWNLSMGNGSGPIVLSTLTPEAGDTITEGDWTCVMTRPESMWTWYAEYDDVLYFDCDSSTQGFDFFFAKSAGMVHFQTSEYELDLVAPW